MAAHLLNSRRLRRVRRALSWGGKTHANIVLEASAKASSSIRARWARLIRGPVKDWLKRRLEKEPLLASPIEARDEEEIPEEILLLAVQGAIEGARLARSVLEEKLGNLDAYGVRLLDRAISSFARGIEEDARGSFLWAVDPRWVYRAVKRVIAEEGLGIDGAIDEVLALGIRRTYFSAERLVRTELSTALNTARYEALQDTGATKLRWVTARDRRVRGSKPHDTANHIAMDGVVIPMGGVFITPSGSAMRFPGDRSLRAKPEDIINCRCTVVPIWEG